MELSNESFRSYVFIEMRRGQNPTEIYAQLQEAQLKNSPSRATVFRWFREFNEGERTSISDRPRSGRPSSSVTHSNIETVSEELTENPKQSLRVLSEVVGISKEAVRRILHDHLQLRKVCSVWVPYRLSDANKIARVECARQLIRIFDDNSLEDCLRLWATEDETWVLFDGLETKQQNKAWLPIGASRPRIVSPKITNRKTMLIVAFTGDGKINIDAMKPGEAMNSDRYIEFIQNTGTKWRTLRSRPTRLREIWWQHDNARPHSAAATCRYFEGRGVQLIRQAPYSPDLNLCDRWLFSELKKSLRKMQFDSADEVRNAALHAFRQLQRERFEKELKRFREHCQRVIEAEGDYVV